jgi:hypothetical protein
MFAPTLIIPTLLAPRIREKGRPFRIFIGALGLGFVPAMLYSILLLIRRYTLRGDIDLLRIPRVALSTQWHAIVDLWKSYGDLFHQSHFNAAQIPFLSAGVLCSGILAWIIMRYRQRESAPDKRYSLWAYGWVLVGYCAYWLKGGSPGVPRMHYFASMGIAALAAGLLYILPNRNAVYRWCITIGLSIAILVNVWSAHTQALAFADSTETVRKHVDRFKPAAADAFSVLYAQCGALSWANNLGVKAKRPIYDTYYVRQWIQTGYTEFWPEDPREDEIRMAELLKQTYRWIWPQVDPQIRMSLMHKAAETIRHQSLQLGFTKVALQAASVAGTCNADITPLEVLVDRLFQALFDSRLSGNPMGSGWISSIPPNAQIIEWNDPHPCSRN